jgi:DNA-binding beta-propeller fold protein YncE
MKQANIAADLWYLSVHGGKDKGNNLLSFDSVGRLVSSRVLDASMIALRELRGFLVLQDGSLLVANAHKGEGRILHFGPAVSYSRPRPYLGIFCAFDPVANPGLLHPFNIRIGPDGNLYVSNQGSSDHKGRTNGATRYVGPGLPGVGEAMEIPPWWVEHAEGPLFPGTVIPSSKTALPGVKRIRDIVFGPDGFLYVADEKRNDVRRYDKKTFEYLDSIVACDGLDVPVHLLLSDDGKYLFIGSEKNNSVLRYDLRNATAETFVQSGAGGLDAPAGMATDRKWLYVCSRKGRQVLRYRLNDGSPDAGPFIHSDELSKGTAYDPEFIVRVTVPGRAAYTS